MIVGLLSRVDFSLSRTLLFSLFFSSLSLYVSSFVVLLLLPIAIMKTYFFFFSLNLILHESEFLTNQIEFVVVRRPGEKNVCVYVCVCTDVLAAFDKSRLFCPRKKMCIRKRESLSSTFVVCYMIY